MDQNENAGGLSADELAAEGAVALPDKEVVSVLDLNADLNLAIDAAAPIDLAVAANANVAAPIDAAVGTNILSEGSTSQALADQGALINQDVHADATADSNQQSLLDQGAAPADGAVAGTDAAQPAGDSIAAGTAGETPGTVTPSLGDTAGTVGDTAGTVGDTAGTVGDTAGGAVGSVGDAAGGAGGAVGSVGDAAGGAGGAVGSVGDAAGGAVSGATGDVGSLADGNLLNVDVNLDGDANIAAPINGAVAANANVAAPIDAAVSANIGSIDSQSVAVAQQDAIINQGIEGSAEANADQGSEITQ